MSATRNRSARAVILRVLAAHPDGVGVGRIHALVQAEYACDSNNVGSVLCQMVKDRQAVRLERRRCDCCGTPYTPYALGAAGKC